MERKAGKRRGNSLKKTNKGAGREKTEGTGKEKRGVKARGGAGKRNERAGKAYLREEKNARKACGKTQGRNDSPLRLRAEEKINYAAKKALVRGTRRAFLLLKKSEVKILGKRGRQKIRKTKK